MVFTVRNLRKRYTPRPGGVTYYAPRIKPLEGIPLSMRLAGIRRRQKRLKRYRRLAPYYRRFAVVRGVRRATSRYVANVRRRILARRAGQRVGVGNYIKSFL